MRILLIVPQDHQVAPNLAQKLGQEVRITKVPRAGQKPVDLNPSHLDGVTLVLASPEHLNVSALKTLCKSIEESPSTFANTAIVPEGDTRAVLSTAAPLYVFDTHAVHLAGGIDPTLPIGAIGLDLQFRLTGRGNPGTCLGNPVATGVPRFSSNEYLAVLTKNLTSSMQAGYFAPLFLGIIDESLHKSHVDTTQLDLQRSPGNDAVVSFDFEEGTFAGSQVVRTWGGSLKNLLISKEFTSQARRIPDKRLPHLTEFIDEVWASTGIPSEKQALLRNAFAEFNETNAPQLTFVCEENDRESFARLEKIVANLDESAFWWEPSSQTIREWRNSTWNASPHSLRTLADNTCITYLIGLSSRCAPWITAPRQIVVADFTTLDLQDAFRTGWISQLPDHRLQNSVSQRFTETIEFADRIIAGSPEQRDFLLGMLAAEKRLDQYTYDEDHSLESLVTVERGIEVALETINSPIHPFNRVVNTPEYEKSPFAEFTSGTQSVLNTLSEASKNSVEAVKEAVTKWPAFQ